MLYDGSGVRFYFHKVCDVSIHLVGIKREYRESVARFYRDAGLGTDTDGTGTLADLLSSMGLETTM
jgi:hypothetical protein